MNLVLLRPGEAAADGRAELRDERARHIREVLRAAPGAELRAGVLDGPRGTAVVESVDGARVVLRCRFEEPPAPAPRVDLLLALPRPKVLKRLWAQVAALGVDRVLLTNAARVERMYFDTHVLAPAFYEPLLAEGLQQAGATRRPRVSVHRRLKVLLEDELGALCPDAVRVVADPGSGLRVADALAAAGPRRVLAAVGPEGGWTDPEREMLAAHGFAAVGMGARVLRSDTACVALLALVHDALRGS